MAADDGVIGCYWGAKLFRVVILCFFEVSEKNKGEVKLSAVNHRGKNHFLRK